MAAKQTKMQDVYDVAIVGAGPSGLYTAHQLVAKGLKCVVLEADKIIGGRVKQVESFVPWLYDVGAEIIHGSETILNDLHKKQGWPTKEIFHSFPKPKYESNENPVEWYYLGRERKFINWKTDDPDILNPVGKIHELVKAGRRGVSSSTNTTLLKHLINTGTPYRTVSAMDALYGKVWSSDIDKLGIHEVAEEEDCAELGYEVNLQSMDSFRRLIQYLSSGVEVRTQWPVREINYSGSITQLRSASNSADFVLAQRVVIAVPASVLKDGDIRFVPELPEPKREAIKQIGFGTALKVVLKFSRRFIPENMQLIICSDSTFTQLWTDGGAARNTPNIHTVTAFVSGDAAEIVSKMDDNQKVLAFLQQLDQMYGTTAEHHPATACYLDALVYDWSKQPYIRGAYSYPAYGSKGSRIKVARNVSGKIFFAGECTATSGMGSGTVNGALETAVRAAAEILRNFKPKSKL